MYIPHIIFQIAVLIIFVISAYKAVSSASEKKLIDFLFNTSVAIVAFVYLF